MSAVPDVEEVVSSKELTRRAWIAVGIAEVAFMVATSVGGVGAVLVTDESSKDGWAELTVVVSIMLVAVLSVVVAIPVAVHTIGRLTVRLTQGWPSWKAGLAHLAVGLACGVVVGGVMVAVGAVNLPAALFAFVLPPGLAGWAANALVPYAARHQWLAITAWTLASAPIVGGVLIAVFNLAWGAGV